MAHRLRSALTHDCPNFDRNEAVPFSPFPSAPSPPPHSLSFSHGSHHLSFSQEGAGIAASDSTSLRAVTGLGLVSEVFSPAKLDSLPGSAAIGHVRYSTAGAPSSLLNVQPFVAGYRFGQLAVAHNGNLVNYATLRADLEARGSIFSTSSGINRFVALFAVPLLSFHFISTNNPYAMNYRFIAADTLQKLIVLTVLAIWTKTSSRGCLEWTITLFSLSTLPNTLVMGIPLLKGMYGPASGSLMVQIVVLQCIIWYTLMLFLFEYRGAKLLIIEQFPDTAGSIISFRVDSDIISLDGKEPLQTEAEVGEDGGSPRARARRHTPGDPTG